MCKEDVDKILMINWYFTVCKKKQPSCNKTEILKRFLNHKIKKFLNIV